MSFTVQMYVALKLVEEALDEPVSTMPIPAKYARLVQAYYEEKFGQAVRAAIARVERGRR